MDSKPKVYFTKTITPEKIIDMYKILNKELPGKVGVKVHSGEKGNINFIKPEFWKPMVEYVKGTIIETNTCGSKGAEEFTYRYSTELHKQVLTEHGWYKYFNVEILDESGEVELQIDNGIQIKKNIVGAGIKNYDSILVLSHFKGHEMGGFGGALKNLSIGFASTKGKAYLHSAGKNTDPSKFEQFIAESVVFKETMADAAKTIVDYYKGNSAFVNVMANLTPDCDCIMKARPPCMKDIGILSSTDPVALDQACVDLIYKSDDPGKQQIIDRIESLDGIKILEASEKLGTGKREYELIQLD